jgi:MOSC domain-containing protein YiiM
MSATVVSVALSTDHRFSKQVVPSIQLEEGLGVAGDCHAGVTVKHRSRVAVDPMQPNLRQVHLIHAELFDELATSGHAVKPGDLGENVATTGIDLLSLSKGTRLHLGATAIVELTGLRNPCQQIENFQSGLLNKVLGKAADGSLIRKSGVMAIVISGGLVSVGDRITTVPPDGPHIPLERV